MPHFMMLLLGYAGSKHKSYKIMRTKMFIALNKMKPNTRNNKRRNLAAVKRMPIQVTELPS
jgi:hypothetical protein